jgi:superfamily II DNA helicase RecQ
MAELNRFLAGHKVLEVEQRFFQNKKGACWSFCVRFLPTIANFKHASKEKVDYKQVLNEAEFAVFTKLREIRKQIATLDAVPAYAVFTDEELAGIAKLPVIEESKLLTVNGIGDKKVAKYGKQFVEMLEINKTTL